MFTDILHDPIAQEAWFHRNLVPHWVIYADNRPIGVLNAAHSNHWGYYIGDDDSVGLGGLVPPYFYNHFFKSHLVLKAEVLEGNDATMKMHLFHGYKRVGVKPQGCHKHGQAFDIHMFELKCTDWNAQKKRYGHYLAEFE